ncbi:LPXTG cell wall anchor domain-containing protein [Mumia sp. ZJ1417]|uniref:LPXTG cell wall anchor domain-containing protein n=1 Tax=unclassified Mumia TaxID=2621872 RepID=UPI00141DD5A2|nr:MULTISPECIES: LPXTG cell wall anchor domain-containing protein [unclassified Mumia]QMW65085.1 LPXTG cell wall anchor domain-containing protein [Mumia sp. ZJ1417]
MAAALGLTVGSLALVSSPAAAAEGVPATGKTTFTCKLSTFPEFQYVSDISVAGYRASVGGPVTLRATMSDLPGVSPAPLNNYQMDTTLTLDVDGKEVVLKGGAKVTAAARAPIPLPDLEGVTTSDKAELAVTVKAFKFDFPVLQMAGPCAGEQKLSTLTVGDGSAPTTPPTTTPPATAPPTTAPPTTAETTPPAGNPGKPAEGTVKFACTLSLGSKFDYNAKMSVSGYRAAAGDPVTLQATMSKLPGIAPVPIDGSMDFTVDLSVGGTATTLKATSTVNAAPKAEVAVPTLKGSVKASGDELDVTAKAFMFNFPSAGIGAECTGNGALSKLGVSSEPPEDDGGGGGDDTPSGDTLPKTGGTNSLPVIGLAASALILLGAAGIVWFPSRRSTPTSG